MFDVIRIPAFKDNYIWLLRKGAAATVVDPGDARPVLEVLEREGLTLASILVTHHHADHQGGVAALLAHCRPRFSGRQPSRSAASAGRCAVARRSTRLAVTAASAVIAVPGHTLGHLAYYGAGCLFCGDTLFAGGCGRLFEGTPAQMAASLARLAELPDETAVYCAHEYTQANLRFALAVEPGNRFLQGRAAEVAAARAKWFGDGALDDRLREGKQPLPALQRAGSRGIGTAPRCRRG
jgi:hydroxyacylglutathione hydrolase